jgi:hypothetical protein
VRCESIGLVSRLIFSGDVVAYRCDSCGFISCFIYSCDLVAYCCNSSFANRGIDSFRGSAVRTKIECAAEYGSFHRASSGCIKPTISLTQVSANHLI